MLLKVCYFSYLFDNFLIFYYIGFNCSIFAYGQTGSGKSYSMIGYGEDKGLIPRVCEEMYNRIEKAKSENSDIDFKVEVSFMEIYNELVFDLLNPKNNKKGGLKVRNHPTTGPYVEDLSKLAVNSYAEIESLMDEGSKARTVAATNMNATSSRSHAVFSIVLTQTSTSKKKNAKNIVSKIHMVDLAGSERANATGASGERLKEGANINKSLSTLGKVISALAKKSEGKKNVFIPYRDSILTWLLRESLGGNSKTIMLAALSPADINYEETLSTLRYANSAKQIKNVAVINEDPTEKLIRELNEEIERLKELLRQKEEMLREGKPLNENEISNDMNEQNDNHDVPENSIQYIKSQIQQSEKLMQEVGKTWEEKVAETLEIKKERMSALKEQGLSLGIEYSELPSLVNLNEDPILSGSLIYHLKVGKNIVGQKNKNADIQLSGLGVEELHCVIEHTPEGPVFIHPSSGQTYINGILLTQPRRLFHGSRIIFGNNHIFRFNHPIESKEKQNNENESLDHCKEIDYNFALSEKAEAEVNLLMENTLHFDISEEEEEELKRKMKAYYEDKLSEREEVQKKLEELKSKKELLDIIDYKQRKQELQNIITTIDTALRKQKEKFSTFSFRMWNEKLERKQLKESIKKMILLIDEANAISNAIKAGVTYSLDLQSHYPNVTFEDEDFEDGFGTYKKIIIKCKATNLEDKRTYSWTFSEFNAKIIEMRNIYHEYLISENGFKYELTEESPFYVPFQKKRFLGFAHVYLKDLLYLNYLSRDVPVFDSKGCILAHLEVEMNRTVSDSVPGEVLQNDRLIGKNIEITLKINKLKGENLEKFVESYCNYKFWNSTTYKTEQASAGFKDGEIPYFHEEIFEINDVREDFLNYLEEESLLIEIWSSIVNVDDDEEKGNDISLKEEPSTQTYKILGSICIQELESYYKNVMTNQVVWTVPLTSFKLNPRNKNPRKVVLQFTKLKDYTLEVQSCEEVYLLLKNGDDSTDKISLKIINTTPTLIEAEWDMSQTPSLLGSATTSSSNGKSDSHKQDNKGIIEVGFKVQFNEIQNIVDIRRHISINFASDRKRSLSRTDSEVEMTKNVNINEILKSRDERLSNSGSHFQVNIRQSRKMASQISAVIEEQQYFQKLLSTQLAKEKLLNELELHEKLETETQASPLKRTKKQVNDKLQFVLQRSPSISKYPHLKSTGSTIEVEIIDASNKMETKLSGYLKKKSGKEWKTKWCTLSRNLLAVYNHETDDNPKIQIDLTNAKVTETNSQYPYSFAIVSWQSILFLQAENEQDFIKWMNELDPSRKYIEFQKEREKRFQSKLEKTKGKLENLKSQNKVLTREINEYKELIAVREEEIGSLNEEIELLKENIKETNKQLDESTQELNKELELLKRELQEKEEEIQILLDDKKEDLLDELEKEKKELEELNEKLNDKIMDLETNILNYEEEILELEKKVKEYKEDADELEELLNEKEDEIEGFKKDIKNITNQLTKAEEDLIEKEEIIMDLEEKLNSLKGSKANESELEFEIERLQKNERKLNTTITSLKERVEELENELNEKTSEIRSLKKKISTQETDNISSEKQDTSVNRKVSKLERMVKDLETQLEKRNEELVLANEKVRELTVRSRYSKLDVRQEDDEESSKLRSEIRDLKRQLKKKSEELDSVNFDHERTISRLTRKIEKYEKENMRLKEENAWLEQEKAPINTVQSYGSSSRNIERDLIIANREIDELKLENLKLRSILDGDSEKKYEEKLSKFQDVYTSSLKNKMKTLIDENLNKNEKIQELQDKNRCLRQENNLLKKDIDNLLKERDDRHREMTEMDRLIKKLQEELEESERYVYTFISHKIFINRVFVGERNYPKYVRLIQIKDLKKLGKKIFNFILKLKKSNIYISKKLDNLFQMIFRICINKMT